MHPEKSPVNPRQIWNELDKFLARLEDRYVNSTTTANGLNLDRVDAREVLQYVNELRRLVGEIQQFLQ